MRRIVGMDIHRTFAEVVFWEEGRLRPAGRVDMTRSGLEGFGRLLTKEDEVVVEATGNSMAVVRILSPFVARVIIANPLEVKAMGVSGISCSAGRISVSGVHCLCEPLAEDDGHLGLGGRPFPRRHLPVFLSAVQDEKQELQGGLVIGEMPPGPHRPAQFRVQGLDGIGNRYDDRRCRPRPIGAAPVLMYGATIRDEGHRERVRWAGRSIR